MRRTITTLLLAAAATAMSVAPSVADEWEISNQSRWDIHKIFISPCRSENWGRDRLGRSVLSSGESASIELPGGCYDLLLVDEEGDRCDVRNKVLDGDTRLTITSGELARCQGYR